MHQTLKNPAIPTHSVYIPTCFGGGHHHHHQGSHLAS